jgi:hypothetical protein
MGNFVVTGLPAYVQENKEMLVKNFALIGNGTRSRISIQTGIKSSAAINYLEVTPVLQDGTVCGFTPQGDITLTQRTIETKVKKVNLEICPETLRGKYAEYLISTNATPDALPFEQYIMEGLTNSLNKTIEKVIWQGEGDVKGFAQTIEGAVDVTASGDIYDEIEAVYMAIPEEALAMGAEIYVSPSDYRKFLLALVKKNYYHYASATEAAPSEFFFPGTDAKVVRTEGLAGTNVIYGTYAKNLFYGCDMEGDAEDIKVWWSEDDQVYKILAKWNMGTQVAFPNLVAKYTRA